MTAEQIEAKRSRVAEALRLHDEGLSIKQTAERMGVAHETVGRYLGASGIPFVKKPTTKGTRKLPCGTMKHCPAFMRMLISDGVGTAEHVCKECGKRFTMRELRESNPWNFSNNPTFCCTSCRNRWHRREGRHRGRERGEQKGYGNVSLLALEERDNHTCYLCGAKTDRSDYRVDESGNFIAGPSYPSIDHVAPLSKGGTHDMSNVRLACRRCNSIKRDLDLSEAMVGLRASRGYGLHPLSVLGFLTPAGIALL